MAAHKEPLSQVAQCLVDVVRERPGIHFRELARAADITSMGQLRHHVDRLQRRGILVEVEEGRFKRYFLVGEHPPQIRKTMARFSRPVPRRIGKLLLWRPMSRGDLRRSLGVADSTLGYHLSRMSYQGDVVRTGNGNRCRYTLADPVTVRRVLTAQTDDASAPVAEPPIGQTEDASSAPEPEAVAAAEASRPVERPATASERADEVRGVA